MGKTQRPYYNHGMCGIFGINEGNEALVKKASMCIAHRGPDATGTWVSDALSFGFNRLAIIDLDQRANQPMWDEAHEIGVVYNGEIYNFQELKTELEVEFTFRTTSDTEVLIYGYKKYGPRFVERINGMFACALFDARSNMLYLLRDHAGIKPLLYCEKNGVFVFGSEMKAITSALKEKGLTPTVDHEAVQAYFGLGFILSPATMYREVKKLPRGSYLVYDLAKKQIQEIMHYKSPTAPIASEDDLFAVIEQSIMDHLIADVPVGLFFSGGTDSSLIAAVLHKHGANLETFSIAVQKSEGDKKYFSDISAELGLTSHQYQFSHDEFNAVYERVMDGVDEPCADMSIFPTYFVSQKAAGRVKVVLSGEGGDEYFFGYGRQRMLAQIRNGSMKTALSVVEQCFLRTSTFKGKNLLFERALRLFRQPIGLYLLVKSPSRDLTHPHAWAAAKRALREASQDPLYFDRDLYLENDLLRKTDLATSLNSLEGRVPLLDSRITAAAAKFESAFRPSAPSKPVLKKMLARFLPDTLVYRGKSGFGMSLPAVLPHAPGLARDLDAAIPYLKDRGILYAKLPQTRAELIGRYSELCFAMVSLYRALINNEHRN